MRGCNGKPYPFIPKSKIWTKGQASTLRNINILLKHSLVKQKMQAAFALFVYKAACTFTQGLNHALANRDFIANTIQLADDVCVVLAHQA